MVKRIAILYLLLTVLSACASTQYWVKPGTGVQETSKDLSDCRAGANAGGNPQLAWQVEQPCMVGKGYALSDRPPGP